MLRTFNYMAGPVIVPTSTSSPTPLASAWSTSRTTITVAVSRAVTHSSSAVATSTRLKLPSSSSLETSSGSRVLLTQVIRPTSSLADQMPMAHTTTTRQGLGTAHPTATSSTCSRSIDLSAEDALLPRLQAMCPPPLPAS